MKLSLKQFEVLNVTSAAPHNYSLPISNRRKMENVDGKLDFLISNSGKEISFARGRFTADFLNLLLKLLKYYVWFISHKVNNMRELIHNFPTFIILDIYDDSVRLTIDEWMRERLKELERAARASIVCPPESKFLKQHCRRTSEVASGVFVGRFKESIDVLMGEAEALSARSCFSYLRNGSKYFDGCSSPADERSIVHHPKKKFWASDVREKKVLLSLMTSSI